VHSENGELQSPFLCTAEGEVSRWIENSDEASATVEKDTVRKAINDDLNLM
jgi:hypothetical protein